MSVVIADDHGPTREVVRAALRAGGFRVAGEAGDATAAVDLVRAARPEVALLEVGIPGNGIAAAAAIADTSPGTAVVMLAGSEDAGDLFAALRAGAVGYLLKGLSAGALCRSLHAVLAGEAAIPRGLAARLVQEFARREQRRMLADRGARLTDREWEVLGLLADGLTTAAIASHLYVSKVTVRSHVAAIVRKLQVPDRNAAARLLRTAASGR